MESTVWVGRVRGIVQVEHPLRLPAWVGAATRVVIALLLIFLFSGPASCRANGQSNGLANGLAAAADASRIVTDAFGRKVRLPPEIHRLVALGSSMAFVTYLGEQAKAVGVEDIEKTALTKPYAMLNRELFAGLPVVGMGGAVRIPDYERILSLRPDVVFLLSVDRSEPDLLQRKLRIPVVAVSQGFPDFDEEAFLSSILLTGEVLNKREKARNLVQQVRALADELWYRPEPENQVVAYVGGLSYKGQQGITSSAGKFFPFQLARIANVVDAIGQTGHCFVDREFVLSVNPPVLFVDGNGLPLIREDEKTHGGYYARLRAVRAGKVWLLLPHTSYFNNPEVLYCNAFFMAKAAYPDHYAAMDPVAKADAIFTLFNGAPLYARYVEETGGFARLILAKDAEEAGTMERQDEYAPVPAQ